MPALGGKGKHQVLLYPADKAHDGENAVVNLEVVAEEGDNDKPLDSDMNTLGEAVVFFIIYFVLSVESYPKHLIVSVLGHAPAKLFLCVKLRTCGGPQ